MALPSALLNPVAASHSQGAVDAATAAKELLNFSGATNPSSQLPYYGSGARSYIRVAGKPLGVCLDFKWQINIMTSEIRTIDTNLPWDLSPGQISIAATLNEIIDPTGSAEAQGLFSTIQSAVHQPYVEMEITDYNGATIFFARGMFTSLSGNIARGQLSSFSCGFIGVAYQHNVYQEFNPYTGAAAGLGNAVSNFSSGLSGLTGGFL